jgi:hypothetical protein
MNYRKHIHFFTAFPVGFAFMWIIPRALFDRVAVTYYEYVEKEE